MIGIDPEDIEDTQMEDAHDAWMEAAYEDANGGSTETAEEVEQDEDDDDE